MFSVMRVRRFVLILCVLLLSGILLWIALLDCDGQLIPPYQIEQSVSSGPIEQPVFSCKSGFYENEFYLEIAASDGASIYYTLDGSIPDESSAIYMQPLLITDATQNDNYYSMRTDTSAGFRSDLIAQYQTLDDDPNYVVPDFLVDKCTIIRAVAISPSGVASEVTSASYFVGISPQDYNGCNVVSLITDPDNLFDSQKGIYVTGDIFTDYLANDYPSSYWRFWEANYRQRGAEWERPATFEFFGSDGALLLSKNGGIRIHGGVSRGTLPRSLNLYARMEYDQTDTFDLAFFETDYHSQSITLNSGGNHLITQFPDYMMTQMVRDLNFATMLFEPYVLFLNGEYWGFYWISEKYDEEYLSYYYQVQPENVIIIKNGTVEVGKEKDLMSYKSMRYFFSRNDMSIDLNYEKACQMIDIDSFIDYYATMIYIARCEDWPQSNVALWRTREISDEGSYSDGKWRWMLFDCNSTSMLDEVLDYLDETYFTSGDTLTYHDTLTYVIDSDDLFRSLWSNQSFQEAFIQKLIYIGENCFSAEKMDAFIQNYMDIMTPVLEESWARFYGSENDQYEVFCDIMESHRSFFYKRLEVVESWFQ